MYIRRKGEYEVHNRLYGTLELLAAGTAHGAKTKNADLKLLRVMPGLATSQHFHLKSESILYVEVGTVLLDSEVTGTKELLATGDTVVVDVGEDHRLTNCGSCPAYILEVQSPGYQKADTIPLHDEAQIPERPPGRFWDTTGSTTKLKVCGIRTLEIAYACYELGVDAIGLHAIGSKWAQAAQLDEWASAIPNELSVFLLTDIKRPELIAALLKSLRCDTLQIQGEHRTEEIRAIASAARGLGAKVVKTVPVPELSDVGATHEFLSDIEDTIDAVLFDRGWYGGTGTSPDWTAAAALVNSMKIPAIVAGGIDASRVRQVAELVRPFGVDVESSVEWRLDLDGRIVKPKSVKKIEELVNALRQS